MRTIPTVLFAALAALGALVAPADARPRRAAPAPGIVVDVSVLRARGLPVEADIIRSTIAQAIAANGPRGRVHVRITGLSLSAFAGGMGIGGGHRGSVGGGGTSTDYLEGDFQVLGPRGEVLAGRPLLVTSPASSGGAWYLPGVDRARIEAISRNFASWVRQYGG